MQEEQNIQEEQELYENYRVIVDKGQSLLRIDKYLVDRIEGASRNKIQLAIKADCVKVNDKTVKVNYRVKPGDLIQVFLTTEPREIEIIPQNIPIDIVYEDKDVIVVNKPAGMVVHPGYGNYTSTLLNALTYHFQQNESSEVKPLKPPVWVDKIAVGITAVSIPAAEIIGNATVKEHLPKHEISCIAAILFCFSINISLKRRERQPKPLLCKTNTQF